MSLVKCPECGKEVSDMAEKCPQCGIDIQNNIGNNSKVGKKRISKIIIFTCIIISFILLAGTCFLVPVGKKKIFEISKLYLKFKDKSNVNDYLIEYTSKDMFQYVVEELMDEHELDMSIDYDFYDFYDRMASSNKALNIKRKKYGDIFGVWKAAAITSNDKTTMLNNTNILYTLFIYENFDFKLDTSIDDIGNQSGIWSKIDLNTLDRDSSDKEDYIYNFSTRKGEGLWAGVFLNDNKENFVLTNNGNYLLFDRYEE